MNEPTLDELDDYLTASLWLVKRALTSGDPKMLRAIHTLMDRHPLRLAAELALELGAAHEEMNSEGDDAGGQAKSDQVVA